LQSCDLFGQLQQQTLQTSGVQLPAFQSLGIDADSMGIPAGVSSEEVCQAIG